MPTGYGVGQVTKGETGEDDAEQQVDNAVHPIMAKQQQLDGLGSNEEIKELAKIMGKIGVLCRMIVSVFVVYVPLMMRAI